MNGLRLFLFCFTISLLSLPVTTLAQWTKGEMPFNGEVLSFAAIGGIEFAGTRSGGVFRSIDYGATWKAVNVGLKNKVVHALATSHGELFAGTDEGVFHSTNNGDKWATDKNALSNVRVISFLASGTRLFAGTSGNGIFISTNGGRTWTHVNNAPTSDDIVLCFAQSGSNLFAAVDVRGLYRSTDDGLTWVAVNHFWRNGGEVLSLTVCQSTLYAGTDDGLFLSTKDGESWTAVGNGLTEMDRYVKSLSASEKYVFAGTASGEFLVCNSPPSWTLLSKGLTFAYPGVLSSFVHDSALFVGTIHGIYRFPVPTESLNWGRYASAPARLALERAERLTPFDAKILFAGMRGELTPDNGMLGGYFPAYSKARNEFERNRLRQGIIDSLQGLYNALKAKQYFFDVSEGRLGGYDFSSKGFPFTSWTYPPGSDNPTLECSHGIGMATYSFANIQEGLLIGFVEDQKYRKYIGTNKLSGTVSVDQKTAEQFVDKYPDRKVMAYIVYSPTNAIASLVMFNPNGYNASFPVLEGTAIYFIITTLDGEVLGIYP